MTEDEYRALDATDRALAALDESDDLVVTVWCDRCADGVDPMATVWRLSDGYVFSGRSELEIGPDVEAQRLQSARQFGQRLPFLPHGRVLIILTESPTEDTDWPPRASCPLHGQVSNFDPNQLLRLAKSAKPGRPEKLVVHPSK